MLVSDFLNQIKTDPDSVEFEDCMAVIAANYIFVPRAFCNGELVNEIGENMGSCKIFAFGKIHNLTEAQTLSCFGKNYREDVLLQPTGDNHQNIRSFMANGWSAIKFLGDSHALVAKV